MTKDKLSPKIIFEDEDILVIDKPAGMVVTRAETQRGGTVQDWIESYLAIKQSSDRGRESNKAIKRYSNRDEESDFGKRSGIVHRLDKETSGVLVVAKNEEAFINLQRQFKRREVKKEYLALVYGKIEEKEFVIDEPVARNPKNRMKFAVVEGGRPARTRFLAESYLAIEQSSGRDGNRGVFTLLKAFPETGRTHQIRVHLTAFNHPVVGDALYAGRKRSRESRKWCPRQFLHAAKIEFKHPKGERWVNFEAELPESLKQVLDNLDGKKPKFQSSNDKSMTNV